MVLSALWGSLGLLLGALGGLLGVSFLGSSGELLGLLRGLLGCSEELLAGCWGRLWGFLGASCGSLGIIFGACLLRCCFFSSSKVLGTMLVSTADLPRLKNNVFSLGIRRILIILLF